MGLALCGKAEGRERMVLAPCGKSLRIEKDVPGTMWDKPEDRERMVQAPWKSLRIEKGWFWHHLGKA